MAIRTAASKANEEVTCVGRETAPESKCSSFRDPQGLPVSPTYRRGVHNLRHTVGQRLRDAGVPEWTVRAFLGHSGRSVTEVYATPTLRELLEASELLCGAARMAVIGQNKAPRAGAWPILS